MNRETIQAVLELPIGCYDEKMDLLNKTNLDKVIKALSYGSDTDVEVCINRKKYIVEICMDGLEEIDFHVLTKAEYKERYGE